MTDDRGQHYRLLHPLGAGGMGEVYLAEDPRLGRRLALKFLPTEFAQDTSRRTRFLTEARAAAALNHPNICTVYEAGETAEGRLFIAFELLEGETLEVRLKRGPLEVVEVVTIGVQLASALEAAHAKGILHRDLKPSNLHLDARGHLKVLDFGLAKRLSPEPGSAEASTQGQTQAGGLLGTPQYMSPEQALGKTLDPRSDLFSCGAVLYELLTGRSPFMGPTFAELIEQIVHRPPEAIARFNYAVPPELERVVLKCLHKCPDQRYQSARELAVDLRGVEAQIRGEPVGEQPGPAQVVTWVLLGINAEELERTVGVQETTRILKNFQEAMSRGLRKFSQARQEAGLGSTVLLSFARPSHAVQWALEMVAGTAGPLQCRAGLHLGEVAALTPEAGEEYGGHLTVCERLLQLARPGQVLMGRAVFDSARQVLPTGSVDGVSQLCWVSHGPYLFEGFDGPMEVCEVGAIGRSPLSAPSTSDKARRQVRPDEESVLGWRPAVGQTVPHTPWVLEEKLGEGGFGEVWLAQHPKLRERRVFKFCFRVDRVRALKRELTLFRLLKEKVGEHPNVVRLHEVYLDESPFYLEEEFVEGKDLKTWCVAQGGIDQVPLETRLEIVAQAAEALQAAHDAGIIHRDVKPGNILVRDQASGVTGRKTEGGRHRAEDSPTDTSNGSRSPDYGPRNVELTPPGTADSTSSIAHLPSPAPLAVKLTDFGIGQVISAEYLKGITQAGFTQTLLGSAGSGTGTTMYLAPEIIAGNPATTRSDIYSLGVVLYQLLIGDFRRPLTTDWAESVADPLLREDLRRCLAGNPQDRFTSGGHLAKHFRELPDRRAEITRREEEKAALERAAYRRGVLRAAALATVAVSVMAWLAFFAMVQAKRARLSADAEYRQRVHSEKLLYAADMNRAATALQRGRVSHAAELLLRHRPVPGVNRDLREWFWRFLYGQAVVEGSTEVPGHGGAVRSLVFSADGTLMASADDGGQVLVRADPDWRVVREFSHPGMVDWLDLTSDCRFLMAAGRGQLQAWDLASGRRITAATVPLDQKRAGDGGGAALFAPTGDGVWVGGQDGWLRFHPMQPDAKGEQFVRLHTNAVTALALAPGGKLLASAGYKEPVALWSIENDYAPRSIRRLPLFGPGQGRVITLAFSPCGRWLFAGGYENSEQSIAQVWDLQTPDESRDLAISGGPVVGAVFSPNSTRLFVAHGEESGIVVWNTADWLSQGRIRGELLARGPRPTQLAGGSKEGVVTFTDMSTPPVGASGVRVRQVNATSHWSDLRGDHFAVPSSSKGLEVWDLCQLEPVRSFGSLPHGYLAAIHLERNLGICFSSEVRLVDLPSAEIQYQFPFHQIRIGTYGAPPAQLSYDGRYLAVVTAESEVSLFRTEDGQRVAVTPTDGPVSLWAISSEGRLVLMTHPTLSTNVILWDTFTGCRHRIPLTRTADWPLGRFSAGGSMLALTNAGVLYLLRIEGDRIQELLRLDPDFGNIPGCAFSPDGRTLAVSSGSDRQGVLLLDLESLQILGTVPGAHGVPVFSPDGRNLVLFHYDNRVVALEAPTFEETDRTNQTAFGQ